jgi:hypothetical protein
MALDKNQLKTNLATLFQAASDHNYDKAKVAEELASLIDAYVRTADITGVQVDVKNVPGTTLIGKGIQTNTVKLG